MNMSSISDIFEIAESAIDQDPDRRNDYTVNLVSAILISRGLHAIANSLLEINRTLIKKEEVNDVSRLFSGPKKTHDEGV